MMGITTVGWRLFVFLVFYCVALFFFMVLATAFVIALIFYQKQGIFNFGWEPDVLYSIKVGFSAGIPCAVGIWFFSKMDENKRKKEQADKEADK